MTNKYSAIQISELLGMKYAPTSEQISVIEQPLGGPVLVIAGAGAGKTEVMSSKIVYMVANEIIEPNEILALTFTEKATHELEHRINSRLNRLRRSLGQKVSYFDEEYSFPKTSTYNSFASQIVKEYGYKIGLSPLTRLITDGEIWQIIHYISKTWKGELSEDITESTLPDNVYGLYQKVSEESLAPVEAKHQLLDLAERFETGGQTLNKKTNEYKLAASIKGIVNSLKIRASLMDIVQAFIDYKKEKNLMDFSDQIKFAQQILDEFPEIIEEYRNKYKVVLLDEYQDTSSSKSNYYQLFSKIMML